jgi:hypothetical protein
MRRRDPSKHEQVGYCSQCGEPISSLAGSNGLCQQCRSGKKRRMVHLPTLRIFRGPVLLGILVAVVIAALFGWEMVWAGIGALLAMPRVTALIQLAVIGFGGTFLLVALLVMVKEWLFG